MNIAHEKLKVVLRFLAFGAVLVASLAFVFAERSQSQRPRQRVITLKAGDDLQAALKMATFGDTIVLQAGATYVGPIILPFKGAGSGTDADYITIRTSEMSGIANIEERIKPGTARARNAKDSGARREGRSRD